MNENLPTPETQLFVERALETMTKQFAELLKSTHDGFELSHEKLSGRVKNLEDEKLRNEGAEKQRHKNNRTLAIIITTVIAVMQIASALFIKFFQVK